LIGASVAYGGISILNFSGLATIFLSLLISPFLGIMWGFLVMKIILKFFGSMPLGFIV